MSILDLGYWLLTGNDREMQRNSGVFGSAVPSKRRCATCGGLVYYTDEGDLLHGYDPEHYHGDHSAREQTQTNASRVAK